MRALHVPPMGPAHPTHPRTPAFGPHQPVCLRACPLQSPRSLSQAWFLTRICPHGWVGHVLTAGTETLTHIHLRADSKSKRLLGKTLRLSMVRAQRSFPGAITCLSNAT